LGEAGVHVKRRRGFGLGFTVKHPKYDLILNVGITVKCQLTMFYRLCGINTRRSHGDPS
jgi:hypothetical protein